MPKRSAATVTIVFDNTVLSNFAVVDRISLLEQRYRDKACTTLMVVEEVEKGLHAGYEHLLSVEQALSPPHATGWLHVFPLESDEEQAQYIELSSSLGPGEAACLAVTIARGLALATDDLAARRRADSETSG